MPSGRSDKIRTVGEEGSLLFQTFSESKTLMLLDSSNFSLEHFVSSPFMYNGMIVLICLSGRSLINLNHKEYEIKENDILTIFPNHITQIVEVSDVFLYSALFLNWEYLLKSAIKTDLEVLQKIAKTPLVSVQKEDLNDVMSLYLLLSKHVNKSCSYEDLIKSLLNSLILQLSLLYNTRYVIRQMSRQEEVVELLFKHLFAHFKKERHISFYADKLCLSPKYLSKVVKNTTGKTISCWINNLIIIEAKRQLKNTTCTVSQISEDLGFASPSFFGTFFKRHTGMTPFNYKRSE